MLSSYLFLDFDGVLNSDAYFARNPDAKGNHLLDPRLVKRLEQFVRSHHCQIVVSSTWREGRSMVELRKILIERGFTMPGRIVGKTPELEHNRGREIARFMKGRPRTPFVILDDDDDMVPVEDHLVQTDPAVGLTKRDLNRAAKVLAR